LSNYITQHIAPSFLSISIRVKDPHDIDKLFDVIKKLIGSIPSLNYRMEQETGKYLLLGNSFDELILLAKKINEQVDIDIGELQVRYRERISKKSKKITTKSANTHNLLSLYIEPLDETTEQLILSGKIHDDQEMNERSALFNKAANWNVEEIPKVLDAYHGCLLYNDTQDEYFINRIRGSLLNSFRNWVDECFLAKEPATGIKAVINEISIDGNPRHTQYSQIAGMVFSALSIAMLDAEPHLFEPFHEIYMRIPERFKELVNRILVNHRGQISNVKVGNKNVEIKAILPTVEIVELSEQIKNETSDLATIEDKFWKFQKIPQELEEKTIITIRKRKGMPEELPSLKSWAFLIKNIHPHLKPMKNKIINTMAEQDVDTLQIPRNYLSEFLDLSVCESYKNDLPRVSYMFESYLEDHNIKIQYDGLMIKFFKTNIVRPL